MKPKIAQNITMPKVDLTAKPYNLKAEDIQWVKDTISGMTDEEKIGQLFISLFFFGEDQFSGNNFIKQRTS